MGRHEKILSTKRTVRLHIRLTSDEKTRLLGKAAEQNGTISDLVRRVVLNSKPLIRRAEPKRAALIVALGELGKIGSNVNQIAHELHLERIKNKTGMVPEKIITDALLGLQTLSDRLLKILDHGDEG